jgi:hypothetical protein
MGIDITLLILITLNKEIVMSNSFTGNFFITYQTVGSAELKVYQSPIPLTDEQTAITIFNNLCGSPMYVNHVLHGKRSLGLWETIRKEGVPSHA